MTINFISSKDSDETRAMHAKTDNIYIMMGSETDEIIKEHFQSLLQRYQKGLKEKMRRNEFIFYSVDLVHYKFNKIRNGSYVDSLKWLKK